MVFFILFFTKYEFSLSPFSQVNTMTHVLKGLFSANGASDAVV